MNKFVVTALLALLFVGCASQTHKRLALTATGFAVGAAVGNETAPENERPELHTMYWASILGLSAAVLANFVYNEEKEIQAAKLEADRLRAELELIQNSNKVLLKEGSGQFKTSTGEEYFQSGRAKWRIYQIDRWVKDGPTKMYHQDKMLELIPINE